MSPTVQFFYDFSCPYAYLASTRIEGFRSETGLQVEFKPFLLGGVFRALGSTSPDQRPWVQAKQKLLESDQERWARFYDVPFVRPPSHPNSTVLALRAALASQEIEKASHALFTAYWGLGKDVSDPNVVAQALNDVGLDGDKAVKVAAQPATKDELRHRTDEAIDLEVFGAPTFVAKGELFWGQDRMDFLAEALGKKFTLFKTTANGAAAGSSFEFWYDFSSPFAYLASTQVEALAQRSGAKIHYRPFLLGALFRDIGTPIVPLKTFSQKKQQSLGRDLERFSARYGVGFGFPDNFPFRSLLPLRMAIAAGAEQPKLVRTFFDAAWVDGQDITDPKTARRLCRDQGLDEELVLRAQDQQVKDELKSLTSQAVELGLCGAPTFRVGSELFWGQDRLGLVEQALVATRNR